MDAKIPAMLPVTKNSCIIILQKVFASFWISVQIRNNYIWNSLMKLVLIFFLLFSITLKAQQQPDSLDTSLPVDSLLSDSTQTDSLTAQKSTPVLQKPVVLKIVAFDTAETKNQQSGIIYSFNDNILTSYTGFADAFRNYSSFQIFDFLDMGLPQYVSGLNLLPHQTRLKFNGIEANGPISGMFNSRFIRLDEAAAIRTSDKHTGNSEIEVITRTAVTDTPYTRIMYREGDFGYSALDIQFTRKINDRLSIGLSGLNSDYDNNVFHGVVYSGTVHYQLTPQIYSRTRFYINQDAMWSVDTSAFKNHKYKERRDEAAQDFFWSPAGDRGVWHFWAYGASSWRTRTLPIENRKHQYKYDRWQIGAEHNWQFDKLSAGVKFLAVQNKIWGNIFSRKYTDSELQGRFQAEYNFNSISSLHSAITIQHRLGHTPLFVPELSSHFNFKDFKARFFLRQESRYPLRIEESVNSFPYSGSKNLENETLRTAGAASEYRPWQNFIFSLSSGYSQVKNEIRFNGLTFFNGPLRDFTFIESSLGYSFYKFKIAAGGQMNFADVHLAPSRSIWLQAGYHDTWFNGALITDAVGNIYLYDEFNEIIFNPVVERFFWSDTKRSGYYMLSYKLAATIKSAQLYLEVDNPLSDEYSIIKGYSEYYRRVRFGINWVLWN